MHIKNKKQIIENGLIDINKIAREYCLDIINAAITSVEPSSLIKKNVNLEGSNLKIKNHSFDLNKYNKIYVIGAGKASAGMASGLEGILGRKITSGIINTNDDSTKLKKIKVNKADHPTPSINGLKGAKKIYKIAKKANEKDMVLCLISGGGSALMPLPADKIKLNELQKTNNLLVKCGANINEINIVRKHLSAIKGGNLAKAAYPATLISLIISDVVGDSLDTIASGPTVPDLSYYKDAKHILKKYNIWDKMPDSIKKRINNGINGLTRETLKEKIGNVYNFIIGTNKTACCAAQEKAKELGLESIILSTKITGEAKNMGKFFGLIAKELKKPKAIIAGGETTVTVKGSGIGGRNQEFVLSSVAEIKGIKGLAIASIGTDGIDGPTNAAGAIADGNTFYKAAEKNLDINAFLKENNSYYFFKPLKDLIITGPTGTNVNDIILIVKI